MSPPRTNTVSFALLQAAQALKIERAQTGRGATLLELVKRSQVGYRSARALVPKLRDRGQLRVVGTRREAYRNRPVAEYAPAVSVDAEPTAAAALAECIRSWAK